jgi:hypothetical protein
MKAEITKVRRKFQYRARAKPVLLSFDFRDIIPGLRGRGSGRKQLEHGPIDREQFTPARLVSVSQRHCDNVLHGHLLHPIGDHQQVC